MQLKQTPNAQFNCSTGTFRSRFHHCISYPCGKIRIQRTNSQSHPRQIHPAQPTSYRLPLTCFHFTCTVCPQRPRRSHQCHVSAKNNGISTAPAVVADIIQQTAIDPLFEPSPRTWGVFYFDLELACPIRCVASTTAAGEIQRRGILQVVFGVGFRSDYESAVDDV